MAAVPRYAAPPSAVSATPSGALAASRSAYPAGTSAVPTAASRPGFAPTAARAAAAPTAVRPAAAPTAARPAAAPAPSIMARPAAAPTATRPAAAPTAARPAVVATGTSLAATQLQHAAHKINNLLAAGNVISERSVPYEELVATGKIRAHGEAPRTPAPAGGYVQTAPAASAMPKSAPKLLDWIKSLRSLVPRADAFVMGNDAGDSDSIISALVLAYTRTVSNPGKVYVPLVVVTEEEMLMRKETCNILSKSGANESMLVYYNDEVHKRITVDKAEVLLTDHNKAGGPLGEVFDKINVVEVVDHHPSFEAYPANIMHIEVSNSCCFLIAQKVYPIENSVSPDDYNTLLTMLVGVTLLDTKGMDPKNMQKYEEEKGPELVNKAKAQALVAKDGWYPELKKLRTNKEFWSDPPTDLALRYDTKIFPAWGDERDSRKVAAAHSRATDLTKIVARPTFVADVAKYMKESDVNLCKFIGDDKMFAVFAISPPGCVDTEKLKLSYEEKVGKRIKQVDGSQPPHSPIQWIFYNEDKDAPPMPKKKKEDDGPKQKGIGRGMQDLDVWN